MDDRSDMDAEYIGEGEAETSTVYQYHDFEAP